MGHVCILGAGTMGRGIAQTCAANGFISTLIDLDDGVLKKASEHIHSCLNRAIEKKKLSAEESIQTLSKLRFSKSLEELEQATWVIEVVSEDILVKQNIFKKIEEIACASAFLASNTSSLSISQIAESLKQPERMIGLHFFNPAPLMVLVEIVESIYTPPNLTQKALGFAKQLKKTPIVVKDSPGFATSRLGIALAMEAIRMVEEKVATVTDIDVAMKLGYGHPMGPLMLTDLVGLDVRLAICENLYPTLGSETFRIPKLLKSMVNQGYLGQKSGKGFYLWEKTTCLGPHYDKI